MVQTVPNFACELLMLETLQQNIGSVDIGKHVQYRDQTRVPTRLPIKKDQLLDLQKLRPASLARLIIATLMKPKEMRGTNTKNILSDAWRVRGKPISLPDIVFEGLIPNLHKKTSKAISDLVRQPKAEWLHTDELIEGALIKSEVLKHLSSRDFALIVCGTLSEPMSKMKYGSGIFISGSRAGSHSIYSHKTHELTPSMVENLPEGADIIRYLVESVLMKGQLGRLKDVDSPLSFLYDIEDILEEFCLKVDVEQTHFRSKVSFSNTAFPWEQRTTEELDELRKLGHIVKIRRGVSIV